MDEHSASGPTVRAGKDVDARRDAYERAREEAGVRWRRTERVLEKRLGGLEGLSVIELGAGDGTVAACMASRGASVTVLDHSPDALARSRHLFERNGIASEFVEANALALPKPLHGAYDVSMSYGFAHRFTGAERAQVVAAHLRVLRHGGVAIVSVPNAANPPAGVRRAIAGLTGRSGDGPQRAFRRREFESYMAELGVSEFGFFGDSFARSWHRLIPPRAGRSPLGRLEAGHVTDVRQEREGRFDERWSSTIVLWAVKDTGSL